MDNLIKLLSILQLTKEQPLTGYLLGGFKQHEIPSLAEHHYTAALAAYFLLQKIKHAGGDIDERKVLLMVMIHDLSELFGGDISGPLNRKYPELREYKDKIGERAIALLREYMDEETSEEWRALWKEMEDGQTDEAVVVKIMDQMDHQFFLEYHNVKLKYDPGAKDYRPGFMDEHVMKLTQKIKDPATKKVLDAFLTRFRETSFNKGFQGMSILMEE